MYRWDLISVRSLFFYIPQGEGLSREKVFSDCPLISFPCCLEYFKENLGLVYDKTHRPDHCKTKSLGLQE